MLDWNYSQWLFCEKSDTYSGHGKKLSVIYYTCTVNIMLKEQHFNECNILALTIVPDQVPLDVLDLVFQSVLQCWGPFIWLDSWLTYIGTSVQGSLVCSPSLFEQQQKKSASHYHTRVNFTCMMAVIKTAEWTNFCLAYFYLQMRRHFSSSAWKMAIFNLLFKTYSRNFFPLIFS